MSVRGFAWVAGVWIATKIGVAYAEAAAAKKPLPRLTPGPPAEALVVGQARLAVLVEQMQKRSGESVSLGDLRSLTLGGLADTSRPILFGTGVSLEQSWVAFTPLSPPATDAPDSVLSALGLTPVHERGCVLARASAGATELCGASTMLAETSRDILARYAQGAPKHDIEATFSVREPSRAKAVYELRSDVPAAVKRVLASFGQLSSEPAAVLGLSELLSDWAYGVAETYERSGPVRFTLDFTNDGGASSVVSVHPDGDTRLGRMLSSGHPRPPPPFFWQAPASAQVALYTSSDNWRPYLAPSERALEMLARVTSSPAAKDAPGLLLAASAVQSCLGSDRALTLMARTAPVADAAAEKKTNAEKGEPAPAGKAAASARPELKTSTNSGKKAGVTASAKSDARPGEKEPPSYVLLGVEDRGAECSRALHGLFDALAKTGGSGAVEPAPPPGDVPRPLNALWLPGAGAAKTLLVLAAGRGTTWLAWGMSFDALRAPLLAALRPDARAIERLKRRPELSELGATPALLGGYVDSASVLQHAMGVSPSLAPPADTPFLPVLALSENGELVSRGKLQPKMVSEMLGQFVGGQEESDLPASASAAEHASHRKMLSVACKLGSDKGCNYLGLIYTAGKGVPVDFETARPFFTTACEHGYAVSCSNLGHIEEKAQPAQARVHFERACTLGSPNGCLAYGTWLLDSGKPGEDALALEQNRVACDANLAAGCANLAYQYQDGRGVASDAEKSLDYYVRACRLGAGMGCGGAGNALLNGNGHAKDEPLAFKFYVRACELDKGLGCYLLGLAYLHGRGTDANPAKAREYLATACDAGHAESCRELAELVGGQP